MTKKKVLYYIHSMCRSRVIRLFKEDPDLEQIIVGPKPTSYNGIPEDYVNFGIKNIKTYDSLKQAQSIINYLNPDVIVQTDMVDGISFPKSAKRVFIMHGAIGNHTRDLFPANMFKKWKGFDLYCGATEEFRSWVGYLTGNSDKVLLNALPQFDLFHTNNYKTLDKKEFLEKTKNPSAKKIILYCGFCCKNRVDYNSHNEDYFNIVLKLQKISEKNNWLALIKPRQEYKQIKKFISQNSLFKQYEQAYAEAQNSRYLHFIHPDSSVYNYFFTDLVISNGYSTIEIEASLAHKPLIIVRTKDKPEQYDPFRTLEFGAGKYVSNMEKLETSIIDIIDSDAHISKQDNLIRARGIFIDGLACKRIQEKIKKI